MARRFRRPLVRARSIRLLVAAAMLVAGVPALVRADDPLASLDEYIPRAMSQWEVPGLAIAVVKDDQIIFSKGYGVRKLGEATPVDDHTLFAIGSTSKAITAACLAILVDEEKLDWDDPATRYLPSLQLFDPYVTRELTVRDLLCHRSGLSRGDQLWYASSFDRDEVLRRVRYLEPSWSFRSRFGYQNIMYLAAGQIIPQITGQSWDRFVQQRIFLPLGMTTACTSVTQLDDRQNVATPHEKIDKQVQAVAWRDIDNIGPAGSIIASVSDMSGWLRLQLGIGAIDGRRVVSKEAIAETHRSHTAIPLNEELVRFYPDAHLAAYGLGWFLHDYHGRKIVQHGGAIDGMRAQVALLPEENVGLVILCNRGRSGLPGSLMLYVVDRLLERDQRDWCAERLEPFKKFENEADQRDAKQKAERDEDTSPSLPLESYAGKYQQELYGQAHLRLEDGKLVLQRHPAIVADLEHWHHDTFRAEYRDPVLGDDLVTFRLDADGNVEAVEIPDLGAFEREKPQEEAE